MVSRPSVVCCCPSLGGPEASGVEQQQRGAVTGQRNDNTGDDNISSRSNKTVASDLNLGALLVTKESSDVIKYYIVRIINYELSAFGQLSAPKIPLHFPNTIVEYELDILFTLLDGVVS